MSKKTSAPADPCPCGSERAFDRCCGPYHDGTPAPDAEALMRSRYSAYVRRNEAYLLRTWHPRTRPATLDLADDTRWLGLRVLARGALGTDEAFVEFVARYRIGGGSAVRMHERSRFLREQSQWFYLDGEID